MYLKLVPNLDYLLYHRMPVPSPSANDARRSDRVVNHYFIPSGNGWSSALPNELRRAMNQFDMEDDHRHKYIDRTALSDNKKVTVATGTRCKVATVYFIFLFFIIFSFRYIIIIFFFNDTKILDFIGKKTFENLLLILGKYHF